MSQVASQSPQYPVRHHNPSLVRLGALSEKSRLVQAQGVDCTALQQSSGPQVLIMGPPHERFRDLNMAFVDGHCNLLSGEPITVRGHTRYTFANRSLFAKREPHLSRMRSLCGSFVSTDAGVSVIDLGPCKSVESMAIIISGSG